MREFGAIGLSEFLFDLRTELATAMRDAHGHPVRLEVSKLNLELQVAAKRTRSAEGSGEASCSFWVFGSAKLAAKATAELEDVVTHKIQVELKAQGPDGRPLLVNSTDAAPPLADDGTSR